MTEPVLCGMTKDKRYKTVKNLILGKYIKTLNEIFDTIPYTVVAKNLGIENDRFSLRIGDVERWRIKELFRLAKLIEVEEIEILILLNNQHKAKKGK